MKVVKVMQETLRVNYMPVTLGYSPLCSLREYYTKEYYKIL